MVQEIITYIIVIAAIIWAAIKVYRRFRKPSNSRKLPNLQNEKISMTHNCKECAAGDCALRDLPKKVIERNIEQCHTNTTLSQ
ncbi:MAG TPA: hypothetical protein VEP89_10505 [Draconibacterium sp.]|nr:hypothetical protein [Draconibacterium sp.]